MISNNSVSNNSVQLIVYYIIVGPINSVRIIVNPEPERIECALTLATMLEKAHISKDNPRTIMKNNQLNDNSESAAFMPRANAIRHRKQRIRNKKS